MRPIDDLREKIDLWEKTTTDTAYMSVLHDVLKQIDMAIYEMDHQEAESPWHSVEEPPKIGVPVLVTYIGYNTGEVRCDLLAAYDGIAWRYWDIEMLEDEVMVKITHWMPIEPPKEEK